MDAVLRHLKSPVEQAALRFDLASDIRGEVNALRAAQNGPVSARPGKWETRVRESRIAGMKWALGRALGAPLGEWYEMVEELLEEFAAERLAHLEELRRRERQQ